jgi:glycosidase
MFLERLMSVPEWLQDAVIYHIFPDRFFDGEQRNNPPNVQPWGSPPQLWDFQGGDLRGVIQKFDYLLDLGVNTIYFTPIFTATSNHRYNTADYYTIDPKLGTLDDFHELLALAHRHGMRVILDGVFNHCGRSFFAFQDVLENGPVSPYRDWFHIYRFPPDAYSDGPSHDYAAWWGMKGLPKFNTQHPQVRKYILDVARYWIEQGADGWRLDVPNEIDDDAFWAEFRRVVRAANPEACLIGEIWTADPRWVNDSHFDSLMNYPLRDAILRLLYAGTLDIPHFRDKVESLMHLYPRPNTHAMYLPLGSHDTERLLTKVEGDVRKARLAFLLQMSLPGAPAIYYGDEIGLEGGKDPDNRRAFPWDENLWNHELRAWVKQLITIRKASSALRRGTYQAVCACDERAGCLAFSRTGRDEALLIIINANANPVEIAIPLADLGWQNMRLAHSLLYESVYPLEEGDLAIHLPAWSGDILSIHDHGNAIRNA